VYKKLLQTQTDNPRYYYRFHKRIGFTTS